jgi:ABC-type lipoprotein export system ATPase subunit
MEEAKLIGICGGSGSGKTTIVNEIAPSNRSPKQNYQLRSRISIATFPFYVINLSRFFRFLVSK